MFDSIPGPARLLCILACLYAGPGAAAAIPLVPGTPVEHKAGPGHATEYAFAAQSGDYIYLSAEQLEGDVRLVLRSPQGKIVRINRNSAAGIEDLPWLATESGEYMLTLEDALKSGPSCRLHLELRPPAAQDRHRAEAMRLYQEAMGQGSPEGAGPVRKALPVLEASLASWRAAGDKRWEAATLQKIGSFEDLLGRRDAAIEHYRGSVDLCRLFPQELWQLSLSLNGLGVLLTERDSKSSIALLEEALEIRRKLGSRVQQAVTLNNIGTAYQVLGDHARSADYYLQSLPIRREIGDRRGEAVTLGNIGLTMMALNRYEEALRYGGEALKLARQIEDRRREATALNLIGSVYFQLGDWDRAIATLEPMVPIALAAGDMYRAVNGMRVLAIAFFKSGDIPSARAQFVKAVAENRKLSRLSLTVDLLTAYGEFLIANGEPAEGSKVCAEAAAQAGKGQSYRAITKVLLCRAASAAATGNWDEAAQHIADAEERSRAQDDTTWLAQILRMKGEALLARNRNLEAAEALEQAVTFTDSVTASVNDSLIQASARGLFASAAEHYIEALMRLDSASPGDGEYARRAFQLLERYRARVILDAIAQPEALQTALATQKERRAAIVAECTRLQRELFLTSPNATRRKALRQELDRQERALHLLAVEAAGGKVDPSLAGDIWTVDRIQSDLLRPQEALLAYSLGARRSFVWVIRKDGIASAILPTRDAIAARVNDIRSVLSRPASSLTAASALRDLDSRNASLYNILVRPIEGSLTGAKRLLISADDVLAQLPFEPLGSLFQRVEISYIPSASTLAALRARANQRRAPRRSLLALGDPAYGASPSGSSRSAFPSLPNTRQEVAAIARSFPPAAAKTYLGAAATEQALKAEPLDSYRYLHFATHGLLDEERPLRSALALSVTADSSEDGLVQASEIAQWKLAADVVTLSACETALGRNLRGEGVIGLSRAFLVAGAQSVVVSLWRVDDAATSELMKAFYSAMNRGAAPAAALREAKLTLARQSPAWRHPYYWAAFVLIGGGEATAAQSVATR